MPRKHEFPRHFFMEQRMRPIEITSEGIFDKETGQKIDMNDPEFLKMIGKKPKSPEKEPVQESPEKKELEHKEPVKSKRKPIEKPSVEPPKTPSISQYNGPKPVSYTKYEVTPESVFTVRFCLGFDEGRPHAYVEEAKNSHPEYELHWVTFRMWTYREELDWRQRCTDYDNMTGISRLNTVKYNELKIRNLLKDWSFSEYDVKFKLLHVGGVLSDESYNLFNGMYPSIVDNIVFLMNQVLEDNQ